MSSFASARTRYHVMGASALATALAVTTVWASGGQAVGAPGAELSPVKGPVGTVITVSGKCTDLLDGYDTTADINLYYPNAFETVAGKSSFHSKSVTTSASGKFTGSIKVGPAVAYTKQGPGPAVPGDEVLRKPKAGDTIKIQVVCHQSWTAYPVSFVEGTSTFTVTKSPLDVTKRPKISGKAKVGKELSATHGKWSPTPASYSYRWLRDGSPIKNATEKTYLLKKKDRDKKIKVSVTAKLSGYKKTEATSKAVTIA